jgi:hypothetical protein
MINVNIVTATEKLIPIYKICQFRGVPSQGLLADVLLN